MKPSTFELATQAVASMTRAQAKKAGAWRYGVGIPCAEGHTTGYRTDSGACTSCGGSSGAVIMQLWRKEIRERQRLLTQWRRVTV